MPDLFRYPGVYLDSRLRGNDGIEVFNRRSNIYNSSIRYKRVKRRLLFLMKDKARKV